MLALGKRACARVNAAGVGTGTEAHAPTSTDATQATINLIRTSWSVRQQCVEFDNAYQNQLKPSNSSKVIWREREAAAACHAAGKRALTSLPWLRGGRGSGTRQRRCTRGQRTQSKEMIRLEQSDSCRSRH